MVPAVEVALDRLDGLDDTVQLLVPGQDDEGTVGPGLGRVGFQAALDEDLVVFLTDFPVGAEGQVSSSFGDRIEYFGVNLRCLRAS